MATDNTRRISPPAVNRAHRAITDWLPGRPMAGLHRMCRGRSGEVTGSFRSALVPACSGTDQARRRLDRSPPAANHGGAVGFARWHFTVGGTTCAPAPLQIRTADDFVNESRRITSRSYEMP